MSNLVEAPSVVRIPPHSFIHVLDTDTNVTTVVTGPKKYIRRDQERVVLGPEKMVTIPPNHYCVIKNPVIRSSTGEVEFDEYGQAKLIHGDSEVRLSQGPFPLYPLEQLAVDVTPLLVVVANYAIHLKALVDVIDEMGVERMAGDEWLFEGPGTYIPKKEVQFLSSVGPTTILPNQALRLRAKKACTDRQGNPRVAGEEWIVSQCGAYLPGVYEEIVGTVEAYVLTDNIALHMRALRTFTDRFGNVRKNGAEWLITSSQTETHVPDVYEKVVRVVDITTLTNRQYCVICDPMDLTTNKLQLGSRKLVRGEKSFFLHPGEYLQNGIQDVYVLGEDEGLTLKANEEHLDESTSLKRKPGDRWMLKGPIEYVPPVTVDVIKTTTAVPLDLNEGIYVRDVKTGKVRAVTGTTYMLTQNEELWCKELPDLVERLIRENRDPLGDRALLHADRESVALKERDKTRVVTFRVPHNAAVQVYDFKAKRARVEFGPDMVMLDPDEQFTQISISGGKPKRPNVIRTVCLLLGPDFFTDIIGVETADHARLSLQLSYNWHFDVGEPRTPEKAGRIFSVPDFVGDASKAIASRIRGAVAAVQFDDFHKNSAKIIRSSVFGRTPEGKIRDYLLFDQNCLMITSVDVQSVEPVDQRTRDALQKSVQLAIEITTNSQEAAARHKAEQLEQEAKGRLERQKLNDEAEAEKARRELLELQAESEIVVATGQAKAKSQSRAEAARIEGEMAVEQARLKAQSMAIEAAAELERLREARQAELNYLSAQYELDVKKARDLANVEIHRYEAAVKAIGSDTIRQICTAGSETELKLLQALNLRSTLITDGNQPINLFSTAQGLIGRSAAVLKDIGVDDKSD